MLNLQCAMHFGDLRRDPGADFAGNSGAVFGAAHFPEDRAI
jgi:hypothetical protein